MRGREKSMCERYMVASHAPPTGDLAHNPACTLTRNRTGDLLVSRTPLNPLSHTSQGKDFIFLLKQLVKSSPENQGKAWDLFQESEDFKLCGEQETEQKGLAVLTFRLRLVNSQPEFSVVQFSLAMPLWVHCPRISLQHVLKKRITRQKNLGHWKEVTEMADDQCQ